jgi:hypothetical protein
VRDPTGLADDLEQDPDRVDRPVDDSLDRIRALYNPDSPAPAAIESAVRDMAARGEHHPARTERRLPRPGRSACAHTYTRRTGVAGRPEAWPGTVTVTWDLTWAGGGRTGTLPSVTKSAPAPRSVAEVQAVVVGSG